MSSEKDTVQTALGNIFSALLNGAANEIKASPPFMELIQHEDLLEKPDKLQYLLVSPFLKTVEEAVLHTQNFLPEYAHLAKHVYVNHGFYHWQLREIFNRNEGGFACADKSRFVLRYFLDVAKGKLPLEDKWNTGYFSEPKLNNPKLWSSYIEALCRLHSGNVRSFLEIVQEIETAYKEL